jgi:hypothetical protein
MKYGKKTRKAQHTPRSAVAKVTISLPADLLKEADRMALEQSTTRSGVFQRLLVKEQRAAIYRLMEEGYREYAEEDRQIAEEMWPLVIDSMSRLPPWKEKRVAR